MQQRLITSVVLVVFLLIIGFIDNIYLTNLVIAVILVFSMFEAKNLLNINNEKIFYFLVVLGFLAVFINPLLIAVIGILSIGGYIAFYQKDINLISLSFYPFLPLMILIDLYLKAGMKGLFWLIVTVAVSDSAAYIIGKNFGKKFIPKNFSITSPNKTFEGVIGGVIAGSIIGAFAALMFYDFFTALLVSFCVSVSSVFGDLFESFLKRRAGVKDSGDILPGHGGVLDRIDGYLFAVPLMWALIIALGNI